MKAVAAESPAMNCPYGRLEGDEPVARIEHPAGAMEVALTLVRHDGQPAVARAGVVRTARRLMAGEVAIPGAVWAGNGTGRR